MAKEPKPKKVPYILLSQSQWPQVFEVMNDLVETVHRHLTNARIALAWHVSLKPDVDGKLILGKAKKASDLDRELAPYDFVIVLNSDFWNDTETNDAQRKALMDHELSHCEVARDEDGDEKTDEKGRTVYRMRKHDIEEFTGVVLRNGIYKGDLEAFYSVIVNARNVQRQRSLADNPDFVSAVGKLAPVKGKGIDSVTISSPGGPSITLTAEDGERIRSRGKALRQSEARH